ncbi:DUF4142 domain-containing protein [Candidatus Nitrotoga arctica]|uniref:DUF4142 domain-containing protein n=1 Tax=Candidatus Nitrotoga arctica TaxID=453162 RepID=A0ABN8ARV7_9PROT|nr:DUF4142 domain-containing protein [Candidatus Nitrotoga arctica]CAG9933172.1 conserved exported protein of unknown function [Candidatus Nitrotoga arctica]
MRNNLSFFVASVFVIATSSALSQTFVPNDAQILGIIITANTVDIDTSKLAIKISEDKETKIFSERMVIDHLDMNKQAIALAEKQKLSITESDASKNIKYVGEVVIARLESLKGKHFDKAYIDNEVIDHEVLLDTLDKILIPNAQMTELKDALVKFRQSAAAHLEHAKFIQTTVK